MDSVPESTVSNSLKPFQDSKVTLFEETAQSFRALRAIANHSTHIFSPTISLLPHEFLQKEGPGIELPNDLPSLEDFQRMWEDSTREAVEQQAVADNLPPFQVYTEQQFNADNQELEHVWQSFFQEAERLHNLYSLNLQWWIRRSQPSKLIGVGPAARRALEITDCLNEVLSNLQEVRAAATQILGRSCISGDVRDRKELLRIGEKSRKQESIKLLATECAEEGYLFQDLHENLSGGVKEKGAEV